MKRLLLNSLIPLLALTFSTSALSSHEKAQKNVHTHKHDHTQPSTPFKLDSISIPANTVVVQVAGAVCSFCTLGIQKNLSKLTFIDFSKYNNRGSLMDIEKQLMTIAIKPTKKANINMIYKAIINAGYEPKRAYVSKGKNRITVYNAKGKICSLNQGTC